MDNNEQKYNFGNIIFIADEKKGSFRNQLLTLLGNTK
jgi:hypothetical protein